MVAAPRLISSSAFVKASFPRPAKTDGRAGLKRVFLEGDKEKLNEWFAEIKVSQIVGGKLYSGESYVNHTGSAERLPDLPENFPDKLMEALEALQFSIEGLDTYTVGLAIHICKQFLAERYENNKICR